MNALFENFKVEHPQLLISRPFINSKNYYNNSYASFNNISNNNINMNFNLNYIDLNNFEYLKNGPKVLYNIDNKEQHDLINKNEIQNYGINELILQNKNNLDYLSELTKFKTELCHSWELTGTCKYGTNVNKYIFNILLLQCVYAHGKNDLRSPQKEENKYLYKTKLCNQFFTCGYCPYGKRCQFSHKVERISYIELLKQIVQNKNITKKISKIPRLEVFKNITNKS